MDLNWRLVSLDGLAWFGLACDENLQITPVRVNACIPGYNMHKGAPFKGQCSPAFKAHSPLNFLNPAS